MITYPTRCQIIDPDGVPLPYGIGLVARTPKASYPHIGKLGTAELLDYQTVRITLDDGNVIYGYECWWKPVSVG